MHLKDLPVYIKHPDGTYGTRLGWWWTGKRLGFEVQEGVIVAPGADAIEREWFEPAAGKPLKAFGKVYCCTGPPTPFYGFKRYEFEDGDVRAVQDNEVKSGNQTLRPRRASSRGSQ